MKKIFILSAALFTVFHAGSQPRFGIFAGPQATTANYYIQGVKQETEFKYGFQAGATMKIEFENRLFFAPALFYSMKGYEVKFNQSAYPPSLTATDNNTTIHCFEIAPMLQVDLGSKPGHVFIKAGPSFDIQLSGKETFNQTVGGTVTRNMKFGPGEYGLVSANLVAQLGYETKSGFLIFAQYTHGASDLSNADGGPAIRHRVYGISFGKLFSRKKIVMDTKNKE